MNIVGFNTREKNRKSVGFSVLLGSYVPTINKSLVRISAGPSFFFSSFFLSGFLRFSKVPWVYRDADCTGIEENVRLALQSRM